MLIIIGYFEDVYKQRDNIKMTLVLVMVICQVAKEHASSPGFRLKDSLS